MGGLVRVVVSYTDGQGFAESATSASTASIAGVNDAPTGGASVAGATTENQVLTANTSTLADADGLGTLHYQWQRNSGSGFVSIAAPDQATYTLGDADVGKTIRVVASYTDGHGTAESVTTSASATIANVNDAHTGGVSITGTATEDQVLTAVSTAGRCRRPGDAAATSGSATPARASSMSGPTRRPIRWATPTSAVPSAWW